MSIHRENADRIVAKYAEMVNENTTPTYNAREAVATDDTGEVWWEVTDVAASMGFDLETSDDLRQAVEEALADYLVRLRQSASR